MYPAQKNCEVGVWSIFRLIGIAIWPTHDRKHGPDPLRVRLERRLEYKTRLVLHILRGFRTCCGRTLAENSAPNTSAGR
jgi:hypothetical protein